MAVRKVNCAPPTSLASEDYPESAILAWNGAAHGLDVRFGSA
jgi:hypothetical protein